MDPAEEMPCLIANSMHGPEGSKFSNGKCSSEVNKTSGTCCDGSDDSMCTTTARHAALKDPSSNNGKCCFKIDKIDKTSGACCVPTCETTTLRPAALPVHMVPEATAPSAIRPVVHAATAPMPTRGTMTLRLAALPEPLVVEA